MNRQDVLERLQEVFRDVLGKPELKIKDEMTAANIEGWDSLAHISLLEAIQQEFGCRFSLEERLKLLSVKSLIDAIIFKQ